MQTWVLGIDKDGNPYKIQVSGHSIALMIGRYGQLFGERMAPFVVYDEQEWQTDFRLRRSLFLTESAF